MPAVASMDTPLLGRSHAMAGVRRLLERAAAVNVPVLLVGETGTGKSHVARLIHTRSARAEGPMVAVNCAAIPESLFESEFFGHKRGAFTGATESRTGLLESASEGTLFLDEVGELPLAQQAKLLTALEEGVVRPVGEAHVRAVDVRLVSATCRELSRDVDDRRFRADLYHRIALLRIEIPPLRARGDDLDRLSRHFLRALAGRYGRPELRLDAEARSLLQRHSWPGNVRELSHALEAAAILTTSDVIDRHVLSEVMVRPDRSPAARLAAQPTGEPAHEARRPAEGVEDRLRTGEIPTMRYSFFGTPEEEARAIAAALERCRGNRTRAARLLGMSRNTLRTRMRRYDLD